jgi:RNA-directed DNA polymerase
MDKVCKPENLRSAFAKVKSNGGAPGVDHVTIREFESRLEENLETLAAQLRSGTYEPQGIRRVEIPKPGRKGETRRLGIPTVRDRTAQNAMRNVTEPIFDVGFSANSHGFRPGKGTKGALKQVSTLIEEGYTHIVDADIRSYFDSIPHETLMKQIQERISDGKVLSTIQKWLHQDIIGDMTSYEAEEGTPQGAVISPLLANIYLDGLDKLAEREGMKLIRYADDFVVMCRSQEEARETLEKIEKWLEQAQLSLHPGKTSIVDLTTGGSLTFLGYSFWRGGHGPSKKAIARLYEKLRPKLRRKNGRSMKEIAASIKPTLIGWWSYFKHTRAWQFQRVDKWVRMRLRAILWKRDKKRLGKRYKRSAANKRWPTKYFQQYGLISLEEHHMAAVAQQRLPLKSALR